MSVFANQAWVTSVLDDADVPHSLVLAYSLRKVATSRKIAVVASGKLSSSSLKALFYGFDHVTMLPENWNSSLTNHDFAKLFILTMKSFETCTYLSPTMLVTNNCDDIFEQIIQHSGFWFSQDKEISCFVVRPSIQAFNFVMDDFDTEHESIDERLRPWAKRNDGLCSISEIKCNFRWIIGNLDNTWHITDASIYNLVSIPLDADTEKLGMFQRMVFNMRRSIYDEKVAPLFKTMEPKPIEIAMGSDDVIHPSTYNNKEPIAIVGISCRYPGANNLEEFWNILINGKDATGTPPDFRWLPNQTIKHGDHFRKTNAGFLKCPVDLFDANFFGISPLEANFMDPQQRLLHEVVWEGLEDASLNPQTLKGLRGGVFVGSWGTDFNDMLIHAGNTEKYRVYMGNAIGNTAGRISFMLGLTGPCLGTDSGCSSAMLAVHTACQSLRNGESQFALACGVNLILEPFDKNWIPAAASADGHCKTFDAKADGFGRAEGVGVLVLKRLSDAIKDGDRIWALIRGTGVAQEGVSKSLGTPTVHCEAQAMKEALADAGITDPSSISYVEAHGTGTQVGDPIEIQAITEAYKSTTRKEPLLVGSVKTNVGHTESCSGITGIMKVVLAMKHGIIPAHKKFQVLNPDIDLNALPAKIPLTNVKWEKEKRKLRLAGVSSFGITGMDVHAIIEEPPSFRNAFAMEFKLERPLHILRLSAKTGEALDILLKKYRDYLTTTDSELPDIAYTSNVGRADFNQRAIIIANSKDDAVKIIDQKKFQKGEEVSNNLLGKVCFLFTGQGSQYHGMARQLYDTSPVFRMHFEYCNKILKEGYGINISQVLWSNSFNISRTIYSQTSIFCVEYALLKLLTSWGITADYALGHSLGEFAAAVCAGILSVEDAIKLVAERSILIDQLQNGKMLVVKADQQKVDPIMKKFAGDDETRLLDYAAINSNDQTVLAGDSEVVLEFSEFCKQFNLKCIVLEATHAFHSKHMDPILEVYRGVCNTIKPCQKTKCGFISAVRGSVVSSSDINADYWIQQTREKVKFLDASKKAVELGCTTFIEIGPQPVLIALTMLNNDKALVCLPTLMKNRDDWETLLDTLGKLYLQGVLINWKGFDNLYGRNKVSLPHYPFIGKRYWPELSPRDSSPLHPLLGSAISNASSSKIFQNGLNLNTPQLEYLKDHSFGDNLILFPGAAFLETCLAAGLASVENCIAKLPRPSSPMKVENLCIEAPLALKDGETCQLQSVVEFFSTPGESGDWNEISVKIFRKLNSETTKWQLHATATFSPLLDPTDSDWKFNSKSFLETIQAPSEDGAIQQFYQRGALAGVTFGPSFKSIENVWRDVTGDSVTARLKFPYEDNSQISYISHPIILDAMMQGMLLLNLNNQKENVFHVPLKIGKFVWLSNSETSETYIHAYKLNSEYTSLLVDATGQVLAVMTSVELVETNVNRIEAILDQQQSAVPELWEEIWRKMPSPCEQFTDMENVTNPFQKGELLQTESFNNLPPVVSNVFKNLEKLCYLNFLRALYELGWKPSHHQSFSEALLFHELKIKPDFRQYFSFICEILEMEGILRKVMKCDDDETIWEIRNNPPTFEETMTLLKSPSLSDELIRAFSPTLLFQTLGENLANFFRGSMSPLAVLFPVEKEGSVSIGDLYNHYVQLCNLVVSFKAITQVLLKHIGDSQQGKPYKLKILEVGAGTGAYSQISIDLLEAEGIQFEYTYTDISNAFFHAAEKKFEKHIESMIFTKFNIEEDPVAQGFVPGYFDLVLGSDVIHASRDIAESLENIRVLMKPSGRLKLFETLGGNHVVTFYAGLLEGYWRFQDFELRKNHCTLAKDKWQKVLESNGFQVEGNFSLCDENHAIIVSQNKATVKKKTESRKTWLLFHHPHHPVSEAIRDKISNVPGRRVLTVTDGEIYEADFNNERAILRKGSFDDFVVLLDNLTCCQVEIEGILYCWALDNDNTEQGQLLQPYFNLTKAILMQRFNTIPKLTAITNGVVSLGDNELPGFHASTLWGYTKSMKIENFEMNCRCIDIADGRLDETRIQEIFYEIWRTDNDVQVAFSGNSRYIPKLMSCPILNNNLALPKGASRFQLIMPETKSISDLKYGHLDKAKLEDNEVEIQVKASALIFKNILNVIKPSEVFSNSNAIGGDFAGIITQVGSNVRKWKVGDQVCGYNQNNVALPSHINMCQDHLIPLADNWSFIDAATIPSVYITSLVSLVEVAKIDNIVLIHTATGGVGLSAIAICKHIGCQIITTAGSQRKRNYLRGLGIQNVFNSRTTSFGHEILEITKGRGVDVVLNTLTGEGFKEASLKACANNARFMELSVLKIWQEDEVKKIRHDVDYKILDMSTLSTADWTRHIATLRHLMELNVVKPLPFVRFDALCIRQALEYMQNSKHMGKIVCTMPELKIEGGEMKVNTPMFSNRATYLITGGCGGIGAVVCEWMIKSGAKHILLAGRNLPSTNIQNKISQMNTKGATVIPVQLNIGEYGDCEKLLKKQIPNLGLPPLKGIMHAAGVIADGFIVNMDWNRLASVFDSKISGTMNLHELTKDMNLEFFVMFSSIASLLGNAFQCNHAAANAFEDAFAQYRASMGLPGMTINWGQWGEAGIAKENDIPGLKPLSNFQGVSGLEYAMKMQRVQTCIPKIDSFIVFNKFIPSVSNYLDERVWKSSVERISTTVSKPAEFWQSYNATTDKDMKMSFVQRQLRSIIRNTLRIEVDDLIENDTSLQEMGMDSLLFIQLRNAISVLVGDRLTVSAGTVRNSDTINLLASTLINIIEEQNEKSGSNEFVEKERKHLDTKQLCSVFPQPIDSLVLLSHSIYKSTGKPIGPPLFIASGMLWVKSQWDSIALQIADEAGRDVITFDARCHGDSPDGEILYELMADDILQLAQFLKIDKFSLMGHSLGGKTAMTLALKYPDLLHKLVVVDITPVDKWLGPQVVKGYYKAVDSIICKPNKSRLPLSNVKQLVDDALKELNCEMLTRDFLKTHLGEKDGRVVWTGKPGLEMLIESADEVFSFPSNLLHLKYSKPALFIKGENSSSISDSLFPNTQKIFTNAKLSTIRNAGHVPHLSNRKDFMEELLSFLDVA